VEWALLDSSGKVITTTKTNRDIRTWKPGTFVEQGTIVFDAPPGNYRLALGIRDPWLNRPAIRFANTLDVIEGWTVLSRLTITR